LIDTKRLHALDAARGLAALAVVLWHWQHMYLIGGGKLADRTLQPFYALLYPFYEAGWLAVEFFFTLSGFVFFWLYGERIAAGTLSVRAFWVARFSRLSPLHLVALLVVAALQGLLLASGHQSFVYGGTTLPNFVLNLLFLQYFIHGWTFNGPEWSVGVEVLLYGLFFIYCRFVKPSWTIPLLAMVGLGFWLMWVDWGLGRGLLGFFAGGIVWLAWRALVGRGLNARWVGVLLAAVLALWIIGVVELGTHPIADWLNSLGLQGWRWLENTFRLVLVPLTVLALALHEGTGVTFWRHLSPLGDLTCALYLLHFPLQLLLAVGVTLWGLPVEPFQSPFGLIGYLATLIGLSVLSYHWLERPAQTWLRSRLAANPAKSTAPLKVDP
jgi:peptidoglycan/LPS O-acetylase OafA/YrhL